MIITLYWFVLGLSGRFLARYKLKKSRILFLLSTLGSIGLLIISSQALNQPPVVFDLPLGIPGFSLHFRWDALSAFFVLLLSTASVGIGLFSSHYFHRVDVRTQSLLIFHYHWLLASMVWVFLAADAYSFLMAWEFMTLSSYFLIVAFKPSPETSHAGFLYFLIAHIGAVAVLLSFAVMAASPFNLTFEGMRQAQLTPGNAHLAFLLALIGFGAKAGLLPLHVWLPEAHSAAPSPISALMSGVMLKTAIYGMLRVFFDLLSSSGSGWGLVVLIAGVLTALLGVILAAMQTDMKRLLAYSSIENLGIIISAIGLALLFHDAHQPVLAALALSAALLHCFNHALFKSLLFLCTGNVLHATGERNLGKLGGLIAHMPWVAGLALIGILGIIGVPPLNGFVSEWLLLQAFLFFPQIPTLYLAMLIPVAAAAFALTTGLTGYVMVKFYGIIFLGKPRESQLTHAADAALLERCGLGWLGMGCVLLGLFPSLLLQPIILLVTSLLKQPTLSLGTQSSWLWVVPVSAQRASYSPFLLMCVLASLLIVFYGVIRLRYHGRIRRGPAWDCGYPKQTSRMQDTAEGFGQPIKHIFSLFLQAQPKAGAAIDQMPPYRIHTEDRCWYILYFPVLHVIGWVAKKISKLQQGRISHYLLYSFLTLLVLLWWVL